MRVFIGLKGVQMTKTSLKVDKFAGALNHAGHEEEVLTYWDESKHLSVRSPSVAPTNPYVFYDGPPFATGLPHYGHLLCHTAKDVVPRYWTMKGYRVERTWGWDCHGIPIENMIEKELDLKGGKKGIEELGIDKFNAACRSAILRYDKEWQVSIKRLGRWVDFEHSFMTMQKTFMESVWWAFSSFTKKISSTIARKLSSIVLAVLLHFQILRSPWTIVTKMSSLTLFTSNSKSLAPQMNLLSPGPLLPGPSQATSD